MKKISQPTDETGLFQRDSYGRMDSLSITGLIIAAGLSSRMGEFKPLLQYEGKSFLENIIIKMSSVCDDIIIVTGHNRTSIETAFNSFQNKSKIKTIFNENYKDGMFTSLKKGLKYLGNKNWVLYHFVDQPAIPKFFYEKIISEIDNNFDWIQPTYDWKKGHPILLGKKTINAILSSDLNSNLKQISGRHNINKKYFDAETESIFFDVDTKGDYRNLIQQK